jgi:hypothetical protein
VRRALGALVLAAAAALALVAAAAAQQAQQENTYAVSASVTPTVKGSKKKPRPVGVKFNYQVGERSGGQPAAVERYRIAFAGLRTNGRWFNRCSAGRIIAAGNADDACPKKALVGTGALQNYVYPSDDPSSPNGFPCAKKLHIWNAGRNKAVLFIYGDPNRCGGVGALPPIPAKFVRRKGATALQFDVPPTVLHPVAGLTVAVRSVQSTIKRRTVRRHGRRRGYFEAVGGCRHGRRAVRVTFTPERGSSASAKTKARC